MHGRIIKILLEEGTPTGIRHAEVVNWTGQAVVCPRPRVAELSKWRDEVERPGVYFLLGRMRKLEGTSYTSAKLKTCGIGYTRT